MKEKQDTLYTTTVIIRNVGERTESICKKILEDIFPTENIYLTNIRPFSAAIRKAFQIGLENNLPWTLCIDADVLVTQDGISQLIERGNQLPETIFEIQGLVLDKFFGVKRPAGNHLYRTHLIPEALNFIPEEGKSLRPESDMLNAMSEQGFAWAQQDVLVGIHDFEQFYADIYRKCFLQAHKHKWVLSEIEMFWKNMSDDKDYEVALWGLRSGKIYGGKVFVDKDFLNQEAKDVLSLKNLKEKVSLSKIYSLDLIKEKIIFYESLSSYPILQDKIFPSKLWNRIISLENRKKTPPRTRYHEFLFRVGNKIETFGKKIKNLSKHKG